MGMYVVEVMHLDLPRRGVTSRPTTPVSFARDRISQRLRQRRNQQQTVQIIEDPDDELPSPSQGSAVDSPSAVAGPSHLASTPQSSQGAFLEPSTPTPEAGAGRNAKRKSSEGQT